jgi:hypothetical protein
VAGDVDAVDWGEDWVSPSYGNRERAPYVRVTSRGKGRRDLITVLIPTSPSLSVSIHELAASRGRAVIVDRLGRHDLFLFERGDGKGACVDGVEMNADMALVRRVSAGDVVKAVALFGEDAWLTVGDVTFETAAAAEATRDGDGWRVVGEGRIVVRE